MSHTRASRAAWMRPPSVFSSSSRVIARASTVADSTHGRGAVARVTAEAPRAPFARARTASVVVVVIVVIVIVIARGSDGRSSPQGPQGGAIDRSGLFEDIPIGEVFFVRVFLIHSSHSKILEYGEPGPKMHVRGGWIQTGRVESSSDATGRPRRSRCRRAPLSDAVERDGGRTSAYRRDAMDERREGKSRGRARARSTADADGARRAGTERCARADPMNLDADERASRFRIHSMRRRSRSNSE